jgi:hypothetical protein
MGFVMFVQMQLPLLKHQMTLVVLAEEVPLEYQEVVLTEMKNMYLAYLLILA